MFPCFLFKIASYAMPFCILHCFLQKKNTLYFLQKKQGNLLFFVVYTNTKSSVFISDEINFLLQFGIVTEVMNNGDLHKYLGALHPR